MTPADIMYRRRVRVIEPAAEVGVTQACREAGVSRTSYYRWVGRASRYGLSALMPKDRRPRRMPSQIPAHEEQIILAEAVSRPTLGAGRLLEHLAEDLYRQGVSLEAYRKALEEKGELEKFKEELRQEALKRVRRTLAREKLAEELSPEVSEEEWQAYLQAVARSQGMTPQQLQEELGRAGLYRLRAAYVQDKALREAVARLA